MCLHMDQRAHMQQETDLTEGHSAGSDTWDPRVTQPTKGRSVGPDPWLPFDVSLPPLAPHVGLARLGCRTPPSKPMAPTYKYEKGGCKNMDTPQVLKLFIPLLFSSRQVEFRLKVVVFGSPRLLWSFRMSSSLVLLCNSRSFVTD